MTRQPPTSTLFPYTTLFRSHRSPGAGLHHQQVRRRRLIGASSGRAEGELFGAADLKKALKYGAFFAPSRRDRKSTRLNSSHVEISYAVFCLKKKKQNNQQKQ